MALLLVLLLFSCSVFTREGNWGCEGSSATPSTSASASGSGSARLSTLSPKEIKDFEDNGYIIVRGLLKGKDLEEAIKGGRKAYKKPGPFDAFGKVAYSKIGFNDLATNKALRNVALKSEAPFVVAELMKGESEIRVLKDALLAFEPKSKGCGWHVDDRTFWPCPLETVGHEGINVWIALSDYQKKHGGGLAIAPTSHRAGWMKKARDVLRAAGGAGTCNLMDLGPEYHKKCQALKTTFDMQAGDAIFHNRFLFHRSDDFTPEGEAAFEGAPLLRYSIRYMPGTAVISTPEEASMQANPHLLNRPMREAGAWYPRAYPSPLESEEKGLGAVTKELKSYNKALTSRFNSMKMK